MRRLDDRSWRQLHLAACLLVALLLFIEALAGAQALYEGRLGHWGFEAEPSVGIAWLRGERAAAPVMRSSHPALQAGDWVQFPSVAQRWQVPSAGAAPIEVTRWRNGQPSPLHLERQEREFSPNERLDYLIRLVNGVLVLLLALLLGRQHAGQPAYRALALAFVAFAPVPFLNFSFADPRWSGIAIPVAFLLLPLGSLWVSGFALRHPALQASPWAGAMQRTMWPLRGLSLLAVAALAAWLLGQSVPALALMLGLALGATQTVALTALMLALLSARGAMHNRLVWLVAALLMGLIPTTLLLPLRDQFQPNFGVGPLDPWLFLLLISQLASLVGLGYAALKHRVFDFELALNRSLVYALAIGVLLVVFALLKKFVEPRLAALLYPGQDPRGHEVLNYVLMVATYIVGHLLFERIDHAIRHLLQHRQQARLKALRGFAARIPHFHSSEALLKALHAEIDRFADGAGSAIYLRLTGGAFAQACHSLQGAPHLLDADDPLLVQLRSAPQPRMLDDGVAALALPLLHRQLLAGLVLVGEKPGRQGWQAEEIAALAQLLAQAHADLQAREAERWRPELAGSAG